jgi:hypothetical protein
VHVAAQAVDAFFQPTLRERVAHQQQRGGAL